MLVSAMRRGYEYLQERSAKGVRVPLVLDSARERCADHLKAVQVPPKRVRVTLLRAEGATFVTRDPH